MKHLTTLLYLSILISCTTKTNNTSATQSVTDTIVIMQTDTVFITQENDVDATKPIFFTDRLPEWFRSSNFFLDTTFPEIYVFDDRLNPFYLEEDFNGDQHLDIAIAIREYRSGKLGFVIVHGQTFESFIIGAGVQIKNIWYDNMNEIDVWKINRNKENKPGLIEEEDIHFNKGPLILENPSIQIEKSELGGGQIYWDGKEYVYFHQTC